MKKITIVIYFLSLMGYSQTIITDANIKDAINVCLASNPVDGLCSTSQYGAMPNWDVSRVTDMNQLFRSKNNFDADISAWDVSSVNTMFLMFSSANSFNQDIGSWDVSKVTNMDSMFSFANSFNQNISSWDVGKVTMMRNMFYLASSFNQDIGSWNVGNVTDISWMFSLATSFNQNINSWDVSKVTKMSSAFYRATSFNQNLGSWNVSNANDMNNLFSLSGLSTENYDAILKQWSSINLQQNVNLGVFGINFCTGQTARQNIIDAYGWIIDDGGLKCSSLDGPIAIVGTWKFAPESGAFASGSALNDVSLSSSTSSDVTSKACLFDDEYVFNVDGTFQNILGTETWLENWQGSSTEDCGTPIFPHNETAVATYTYNSTNGSLNINGKGAYLGLSRIINDGELTTPNDAPDSITYIATLNGDILELDIDAGGIYWSFKLVRDAAPIAVKDTITIEEDANTTSINVIENDTDTNGDVLSLTAVDDLDGQVNVGINLDGVSIDFKPYPNFYGTQEINYTVSDGKNKDTKGSLIITVTASPDAPQARNDFATIFQNADLISINVIDNDLDPDNFFGNTGTDTLTLISVSTSGTGTVAINPDGLSVDYTPAIGFFGTEKITYTVSDGVFFDANGSLTVQVNNGDMALSDIYSQTHTEGSGGTNTHIDFGMKSYDIFSDMLSGDMALSKSTYSWYRESITEFKATQDFSEQDNRQVWNYYYGIIKNCNNVIDNLGGSNATLDKASEKAVMGQLKALRAHSYFYLAQFFQEEYIAEQAILPILLTATDSYGILAKAQEVYDIIENDLDSAISLLEGFNRSNKTQINKSIAQGIYAYVLGARGTNYTKAYNLAKAAITGGYTLMSSSEITGGFNDVYSSGWMWGIDVNNTMNLGLTSWWGQIDYFSYGYASFGDSKSIDAELFNKIPANDSRKSQFNNNPGNYTHLMPLNKFYDSDRTRYGSSRIVKADYIYMRVAEMHLLAAEYAAYSDNDEQAKTELKTLVSKRVLDTNYIDNLSGQQLKDEIYLQTRIELWGEGKSYLAMKRNKANIKRGSNHLSFVGEVIPYNDNRLTFNIPQSLGYTKNRPILTLLGNNPETVEIGKPYTDAGATATDTNGDISDDIIVTGTVDINTIGSYTINYNVTDISGRSAITLTRIVNVTEVLGVEDNFEKYNFTFNPNPVNSSINLKAKTNIDKVMLFNSIGQKVKSLKPSSMEVKIDIVDLPNAIYIMKVIIDKRVKTFRVLKN